MDSIFSILSYSSFSTTYQNWSSNSLYASIKYIHIAIHHNAQVLRLLVMCLMDLFSGSNLQSSDHSNNSICSKRTSGGHWDTARLNSSNPQKENTFGISFIPRSIKRFNSYILLNHLKISCRHHETSAISISACISWANPFSPQLQYSRKITDSLTSCNNSPCSNFINCLQKCPLQPSLDHCDPWTHPLD